MEGEERREEVGEGGRGGEGKGGGQGRERRGGKGGGEKVNGRKYLSDGRERKAANEKIVVGGEGREKMYKDEQGRDGDSYSELNMR